MLYHIILSQSQIDIGAKRRVFPVRAYNIIYTGADDGECNSRDNSFLTLSLSLSPRHSQSSAHYNRLRLVLYSAKNEYTMKATFSHCVVSRWRMCAYIREQKAHVCTLLITTSVFPQRVIVCTTILQTTILILHQSPLYCSTLLLVLVFESIFVYSVKNNAKFYLSGVLIPVNKNTRTAPCI